MPKMALILLRFSSKSARLIRQNRFFPGTELSLTSADTFIMTLLISRKNTLFTVAIAALAALQLQAVIQPEIVPTTDLNKIPQRYSGLLYIGDAIGSASLASEGIFTTAAHVIFDDEGIAWEPTNQVFFYPGFHRNAPFRPNGTFFVPVGIHRWTSYAGRVEEDDSEPGFSSIDTFNLDYAVAYLNRFANDPKIELWSEVNIDAEGEVSILREDRMKTIIGYPSNTDFIPASSVGFRHQTDPANYFSYWNGFQSFPETWYDSGRTGVSGGQTTYGKEFWVATYDFEGVATYSGNSGGPMYVETDLGEWTHAGVVVGSSGNEGVLMRGIDDEAWALVESAIDARDPDTLRRPLALEATQTSATSVALAWEDRSATESIYRVLRSDDSGWTELVQLPADTQNYTDTTVLPGKSWRYAIQAIDELGNRSARSPIVEVQTPGFNAPLAQALNAPFFAISSTGDSNWKPRAEGGLQSGKISSLGESRLALNIVGPGTLSFTWDISSEINVDYTNPASENFGEIYDALFIFVDGQPWPSSADQAFISGFGNPTTYQLTLPEGPSLVEWVYAKDPYTTQGQDAGFVSNLEWQPGPAAYPVFGAFAFPNGDYHGSAWFGNYAVEFLPWVGHLELGWLYLQSAGDGVGLFAYSLDPLLGQFYTSPQLYPYLYRPASGDWLYYYKGTGAFGTGAFFTNISTGASFQLP
jgi:hypothetical protein